MRTLLRTRAIALFSTVTLACGDAQPPTGPLPPAEPTGTFLLWNPSGILFTLSAGSMTPREVSRWNFPFIGTESSLLPGGKSIVGFGTTGNGIPQGLRQLHLGNADSLSTLFELAEPGYVFDTEGAPDGRTVALAAANLVPGRATLMRMDLTTRTLEQLWINTDDDTEFARFSWLPDRSGLVGQLWGINRFRMARFDLGTRRMTILSAWMNADRLTPTMRLSRDGRTIAYNTQEGELRFITLDGRPARGFPTDLKGIYPAFSPDGRLLVYSKLITEPSFRLEGIWIYRFSDGATWQLFPSQGTTETYRTWLVLDWE